MPPSTNYLTLKNAAERLGVHEQTLRAWERKGLIQMARLPQSGYRRVPVQEVERLRANMIASNESAQVYIVPPSRDPAVLARAEILAAEIVADLAEVCEDQTFDEYLESRRGRVWLQ